MQTSVEKEKDSGRGGQMGDSLTIPAGYKALLYLLWNRQKAEGIKKVRKRNSELHSLLLLGLPLTSYVAGGIPQPWTHCIQVPGFLCLYQKNTFINSIFIPAIDYVTANLGLNRALDSP